MTEENTEKKRNQKGAKHQEQNTTEHKEQAKPNKMTLHETKHKELKGTKLDTGK